MAEPVAARIVHRLPGRVRLRIDAWRGDPAQLDALALDLALEEGVRAVDPNPLTGGLLVLHEGPLEPLLERLAAAGRLRVTDLEPRERPFATRLGERLGAFDRELVRATAGELDARGAVLLAFLGLAFVQALRGQLAGPALSLLWYASRLAGPPGRS